MFFRWQLISPTVLRQRDQRRIHAFSRVAYYGCLPACACLEFHDCARYRLPSIIPCCTTTLSSKGLPDVTVLCATPRRRMCPVCLLCSFACVFERATRRHSSQCYSCRRMCPVCRLCSFACAGDLSKGDAWIGSRAPFLFLSRMPHVSSTSAKYLRVA